MDLPTCPACKQSVLDDDAVDCPFCGAPMKGGPGAPRSPAATKTVTAAAKPPATKGTAPGAAAVEKPKTRPAAPQDQAPTPPPDEDPFAVDQSAAAGAVPLSPKPAPGKSLELVCPMCETKGFVSPRAAGKQVKCCNPKCMVPIFTAPAAQKKEAPAPPPEPKKSLPWLLILVGIAAVLVAAVCIYLIVFPPGPTEIGPATPPTVGKSVASTGDATNGQGTEDNSTEKQSAEDEHEKVAPSVDPKTKARNELVAQLLRRIREVSGNIPEQHKAAWRRMAATAYLAGGDQKRFRDELELLKNKKGGQSAYEALVPITFLAWQEASSAPEQLKKTVAKGEPLAAQLPTLGRFATQAAVGFAPVLWISGKTDDARKLIAEHHAKRDIEQLAGALEVVINDRTFNLDRTLPGRAVGEWQAPLDAAVVLILTAHGRWDDAHAWAGKSDNPVAKTEGLLVWAESFAAQLKSDDAEGFGRAAEAAKELPPEGAARLLARLAQVRFAQGDRRQAAELLGEAMAELEKLPPPAPLVIEKYKPLLDLKLPDATRLWEGALAAVEVATAQAKLGGAGKAWDEILLAMRFLQASAPTLSATQQRWKRVDEVPAKVQEEIAREMGLTKDEKRTQFTRYKTKLDQVRGATLLRFEREVDVLEAAARMGLLDQVWDELLVLDRKQVVDEREPLITTSVPLLVGALFGEQGKEARRKEVFETAEDRINTSDPKVAMRNTEDLLKNGDVAGCLGRLTEVMNADGLLHEWTLRLACRLVNQGKFSEALQFCSGIPDIALRHDGLFLVTALAARSGHAPEVWKLASSLAGMEGTAVCTGLVVGLGSSPP